MTTTLGIPSIPARTSTDVGRGIAFTSGHHFTADPAVDIGP